MAYSRNRGKAHELATMQRDGGRSGFPVRLRAWALSALPIILLVATYLVLSWQRHLAHPNDRLLPLPAQLWSGLLWSLSPHPVHGRLPLVDDTLASMGRLLVSLVAIGGVALTLALGMHLSEMLRRLLLPQVVIVAKIPPIALLPILLLWLGVNETAKLVLLILGLAPAFALLLLHQLERDARTLADKLASLALPRWQKLVYVSLPLLWPSFLHVLQTSLGAAWLLLLVAETFGAESGLGYRIFVVRRYLAMDVILVYVVWITLLSLGLYLLLGLWRRRYSW